MEKCFTILKKDDVIADKDSLKFSFCLEGPDYRFNYQDICLMNLDAFYFITHLKKMLEKFESGNEHKLSASLFGHDIKLDIATDKYFRITLSKICYPDYSDKKYIFTKGTVIENCKLSDMILNIDSAIKCYIGE